MTTKKDKKELPNLAQRYEYRAKKRSTTEGLALEALAGDRECITVLASYGRLLMEQAQDKGGNLSTAAEWLEYILSRISSGEEPNKAFGWTGHPHGSWAAKRESFNALQKNWFLAKAVEGLIYNLTGKSYSEAIEHIAAAYRVDRQVAGAAITSVLSGAKLSKAQAKEIALDIVAELGSGTFKGKRDSVLEAYKDFVRQG